MGDEKFIQIVKGSSSSCPVSRGFGPIADKFFIAGAISSLIGMAWLGVYLWLSFQGKIQPSEEFFKLRTLHVLIQLYLFFGFFVLGFLAQAGAKLVGAKVPPSPLTLLWIPLLVLAVILWHFMPEKNVGKYLISGVFFSALAYAVHLQKRGEPHLRATVGRVNIFGLLIFAISPFLSVTDRGPALFVLWGGVVSLIIGSGQQFIAAFLGGKRCSETQSIRLLVLIGVTAGILFCGLFIHVDLSRLAGFFALFTILYYIATTKVYLSYKSATKDGLALSFLTSFSWAVIGCFILLYHGKSAHDLVFHLWAIGWATPLIFAVSAQIMGFLSGMTITKSRYFLAAIGSWQLVPIGRSLLRYGEIPNPFLWLVVGVVFVVLPFWCIQLLRAEHRLISG